MPQRAPALATSATDVEIFRYWLTNPVAREQLVDLLALVCERLIELVEGSGDGGTEARRLAQASLKQLATEGREIDLLRFCPTCGRPLSRYFDPRDSWVVGLVCSEAHDFSYRGWRLWLMDGGGRFELWFFPGDDWLASTADDAIDPSGEHWSTWESLVHPQLRAALSRLRGHLPQVAS